MKYLLILLLLAGCAQQKSGPAVTPDFIHKLGIIHTNRMESTPFVWTDGRQLTMVAARDLGKIEIYDGATLISEYPTTMGLASALVENGTLYIFGASTWATATENQVAVISTTDLISWVAPKMILPAVSNRVYFNSSVTKRPDGSFIMAVETCEPHTVCFNARFFESTDLENWTEVGKIFKPQKYAACPTIRLVGEFYYVFYLTSHDGIFTTEVSRSKDLLTWDDSSITVLASSGDEGTNASDMDFVEYHGDLVITYADGDQLTWTNIRSAVYHGTLKSFVERFF